jgi:polyisoprenyl-phosphate glycosyltransferase
MTHLSIVSPVYQAEEIVELLVSEIIKNVQTITDNFEIILVEDGSKDASWQAIETVCKKYSYVRGLKLSRNFGQHYAITAGLQESKGEWVVVMDCDLQDSPIEIPNLYNKTKEGYDLVFGRRSNRKDGFFKILFSKIFYAVFSYLTDTRQDATVANFGIYHRNAITSILSMNDHIRYFPTMAQWVGFRKTYVDITHNERYVGDSTYNFKGLMKLAMNNIISFSDKPLRLTIQLGFFIAFISFFIGLYYIIKFLSGDIMVSGYTSLILSIWFLSGIIILVLGILGIYIGKVFEKVKDRPLYIVEKKTNF